MAGGRKTFDIGRDSKTGRFISVKEAKSRPNTTTVERVPKAGHGNTTGNTGPRNPKKK